jgi:tetratricopeptide (TPR) repeat protein
MRTLINPLFQAQESSDTLFSKANAAYNQADYTKAEELYQRILSKGEHSAELYYNLGNTYYRLNQVAESIFYFEKAKQLAPEKEDLQINSSFAQNMTIDAIEPLPESQLAQIQKLVLNFFTTDNWSKIALGFLWIFALLFLGYLFTHASRLKRTFFFISIASFVLFVGSLSIAFTKDNQFQQNLSAILFSPQIEVWSEPNEQGDLLFILHEGTRVQLIDSLAEWKKIRIANGSEGWMQNATLRNLNGKN